MSVLRGVPGSGRQADRMYEYAGNYQPRRKKQESGDTRRESPGELKIDQSRLVGASGNLFTEALLTSRQMRPEYWFAYDGLVLCLDDIIGFTDRWTIKTTIRCWA